MIKIETMNLKDLPQIKDLIYRSFLNDEHSNHTEQDFVEYLVYTKNFVPELALTAKKKDKIVRFLMLYPIGFKGVGAFKALGLAPLCVGPEFQKQGIGSSLLREAHRRAKRAYDIIALVGHPAYYLRFGYEKASKYNTIFPFELPDEVKMIKRLHEKIELSGDYQIEYPQGYFA